MKPVVKIVVAVIGGAFALMLVSGLIAKAMLSESRIQGVLATLESRVPVAVTATGGEFDLAQWFLFRPAIGIDGLSVGNPPGYSETPLLTAEKVYAQVALFSLFSGRTEIHSIRLAGPVLTVERGRGGRTNLETVLDAVSRGGAGKENAEPAGGGAGSELSIDSFHIDNGVIRYVDAGSSPTPLTVREINLALTDFSTDSSCRFNLSAALFESGSSPLGFDGRGGPFKAESIPAEGELTFELAPAEMPTDMRERIFGQLLRDPGGSSRVALNASVNGDLIESIQGNGKVVLSSFQIGPPDNRLPLVGEAPLSVTVQRPLARPGFELAISGGSLQLGQGSWKGDAEVRYDGNRFLGGTSGAITSVRIEELLNAFTASKDKAFGRAEIPAYRLSFAGRDAGEIKNSLNGNGQVALEEGRIAMFDMVNTIQGNLNKALGGSQPAAGDTDFARFASSVEIGGQMMRLPDLVLESSQTQISGNGYITFAKELNFDLVSTIHGPLAATLSSRMDASGQPVAGVPVRVRGTVDEPKVTPDIGKMAVETIREKAGGILDQLFRKKEQTPQ